MVGAAGLLTGVTTQRGDVYWLDTLEDPGRSKLGTEWSGITDGVMGGVSDMQVGVVEVDGERAYRMTGVVRTANNGGFIQIALPLSRLGMDVSEFAGVRLRIRGNGERYAVHLRTLQNLAPWDYFSASFDAVGSWTDIDLPFSGFVRASGGSRPRLGAATRLALVAIGRDFTADVSLARIGLYKG